jgi:ribosome biogenesis protein MAK21
MQPLSGGDSHGVLLSNKPAQNAQGPLNTEAFWRKKAEDVAVDEVFFHRYFNQVGKAKHASAKKTTRSRAAGDSDSEEDENEDEIWQALVDSRPEVEGPSDDDSDMEMLDLDDSDAESFVDGSEIGDDEVDVEGDELGTAASDNFEEMYSGSDDNDEGGVGLDELFTKELQRGQVGDSDEEKGEETSRQKKRRMKSLPTFASAEDYAEMLDNDEDEDL